MATLKDALCIPPVVMDMFRQASETLKADQQLVQEVALDISQHAPNYDDIANYLEGLTTIDWCCSQVLLNLFQSGSDISPEVLIKLTRQTLPNLYSSTSPLDPQLHQGLD